MIEFGLQRSAGVYLVVRFAALLVRRGLTPLWPRLYQSSPAYQVPGDYYPVRRMAEPDRTMTEPELEQHGQSLAKLSDDSVRSLYREAWARCRMEGDQTAESGVDSGASAGLEAAPEAAVAERWIPQLFNSLWKLIHARHRLRAK